MRFPAPLVTGRLIKRYKRFLADIRLDTGDLITAHCANPGSMLGLVPSGARVWLSQSADPKRKLKYSWEIVEVDGALVGINTGHPNGIVAEAVAGGRIAELAGYASLKREVAYGVNSRIDLLLDDPVRGRAFVEVKNVTLLRRAGLAEFPDSVTARGAKHLAELARAVEAGDRAVMLYLIQRGDNDRFGLAADIDPAYAAAFADARARGLEAIAYGCRVTPDSIEIDRPIPLV